MIFKKSVLRNLLLSFLAFGLLMGIVFPFYADFFVDWKPGLKIWFVIGCLVAGTMIGIANFILCKVILLKKLQQISNVSTAISQGDLTLNCAMQSEDLIGEIVASFNQMAANLRNIIGEITSSATRLEANIGKLSAVFAQTKQGMVQQEQQTIQIGEAINGLQKDAQDISEKANHVREMTTDVRNQSNQSALIATEAIGSISALASRIEQTAGVISKLEDKSSEIGVVIDVIRGIAEQTNLLALNAAIEAARAGEQGRGFAVVADEVRTLATRTQESTLQIESIITELQSGSKQAVSVMHEARAQTEKTEENFENAAMILAEISGQIDTVTEHTHHFSQTANKQTEAVQNVLLIIDEIRKAGQKTIEDSNFSEQSCLEVYDQGSKLKQLVQNFKL